MEKNKAAKQNGAKADADQLDKVLKGLGNASPEDKLLALAKSFVELEKENGKRTVALKQNEKMLDKEQREKDHLQRECNKGILIRDKLEQVCREQQKLMKSIKSESMTKIRDEEEKRKETQAHFQQSINEIFATLGKNNDENLKIKEANLEMTKKFKFLSEQYELREKQLEKLNDQIKLEGQLNDAKLAKVQMEATIEKEILLREKQAALEDVIQMKKALMEMQKKESLLKEQLTLYTDKYDEFQNSLQKSNGIFITYKQEIDKMSKRIKGLEKECYEWRVKYEKCNRALLNMAADKQAQDAYVAKSSRQLGQLQKLCRTLQAERGAMLDVLKTNNIERPAMPELPPEPTDITPAPKPSDKLDVMTRNCDELKRTLAELQGQMNAITADVKQKSTQPPPTANKKNKNKKNKAKAERSNETAPATNGTTTNGQSAAEAAPVENEAIDEETESKESSDDPNSNAASNEEPSSTSVETTVEALVKTSVETPVETLKKTPVETTVEPQVEIAVEETVEATVEATVETPVEAPIEPSVSPPVEPPTVTAS